jgi:hypothetical protein
MVHEFDLLHLNFVDGRFPLNYNRNKKKKKNVESIVSKLANKNHPTFILH